MVLQALQNNTVELLIVITDHSVVLSPIDSSLAVDGWHLFHHFLLHLWQARLISIDVEELEGWLRDVLNLDELPFITKQFV